MKTNQFKVILACLIVAMHSSCNLIQKASSHDFNSGFYNLNHQKVYLDVTDEKLEMYAAENHVLDTTRKQSIDLLVPDSTTGPLYKFSKQSLDIDITTILLKYRPSVHGMPEQLSTDVNFAIYAGWRYDVYKVKLQTDVLGKRKYHQNNWGFDFGLFLGPGVSPITPYTLTNNDDNEYSGMILQTGVAGFIESNIASFGIALGFDSLFGRDHRYWIYNGKPWVGFIVGIALN